MLKSHFRAKLLEYLRQVEQDQRPLIVIHHRQPVIKVNPYNINAESILASLRHMAVFY